MIDSGDDDKGKQYKIQQIVPSPNTRSKETFPNPLKIGNIIKEEIKQNNQNIENLNKEKMPENQNNIFNQNLNNLSQNKDKARKSPPRLPPPSNIGMIQQKIKQNTING